MSMASPAKTLKEWLEEAAAKLQESDWSPVAGSIANTSSQTFEYPGGSRVTVSGLGGVEAVPSEVSVTQDGDTFNVTGPSYSQLGMQGYAQPLGNVNRKRDYEDVNPKLDASQEFASAVKSDVFMNARVQNPKTTSVGYFSYLTPAEQLEQARDAKKRFAGGLGNHNFNDHVKSVVGSGKYQQLDAQRKANEESATRGIWDKYKEAIRSGQYELTGKLQKQAEQIQNKVYKDFVSKVETLYFDEFKKQTGLDPFGSKTSTPDAPEDSTDSSNDTSTIDAPIEDPYFQRIFPDEPVPTPENDVLDQLVQRYSKYATAKNFLDHYADNFVYGDGKQDQNLTNLMSSSDLQWLTNAFAKQKEFSDPRPLDNPQDAVDRVLERSGAPAGIIMSIGNGAQIDMDYYKRTGDIKLNKSYVFTEPDDFGARSDSDPLSRILTLGTAGYARIKAGGHPFADASNFIQNPMRFHVVIPGPKKKKKKVDESLSYARIVALMKDT